MTQQIEPALDIFKRWQSATMPPDSEVAFTAASAPEISLWQLDLSADPQQAQQTLSQLEAETQQAKVQLNGIPNRLDAFVSQTATTPAERASFSSSAVPDSPLPQAESDLQQLVSQIRQPMSFTAQQAPGVDLKSIGSQFQQAINRLFQLLTHLAWVETRIEGQLLAQTTVNWAGETRTAWQDDLPPSQQALHQRNLTVALAGRVILMRTLVITTQAAAKIALLMGTTGGIGSVLTIPIAWKYVSQILAEIEQYQSTVEGTA